MGFLYLLVIISIFPITLLIKHYKKRINKNQAIIYAVAFGVVQYFLFVIFDKHSGIEGSSSILTVFIAVAFYRIIYNPNSKYNQ